MRREHIVTVFLFLALAGLLYLLADLLLPYAAPVAWAMILAVVFSPANRALKHLLPSWHNFAAATMTLLVFTAVVVPALLLSGVLAREAVEGYQHLAQLVSAGHFTELNEVGKYWLTAPLWDWVRDRMASGEVDPTSFALAGLRWVSEFAATRAAAIARNVFSFFVSLGIMLFTLFFAFRDGELLVGRAHAALPMEAGDRERLFQRLQQTIVAVVQGLTVTAAIQGLLLGLGVWAVGIPFAVLLGTAAFFLAFLPVGGAALVWIPTVAGVVLTGQYLRALLLGLWCLLVISSVDNLLRPTLIGGRAQLSTPVLFFGILGGLQAYGFIGLFVGPAILAAFSCLAGIYREHYGEPTLRGGSSQGQAQS